MDLELLKYPVGKYTPPQPIQENHLENWKSIIARFPEKLSWETGDLTNNELSWRYRPDGWTIRQVIHHCADSHMNALIRFKLALTENEPTILPYKQDAWANLGDVEKTPIEDSLNILRGLHARWSNLLNSMSPNDFKRRYNHPEHNHKFPLGEVTGMYAWHCSHHLAHVRQALHYKGEF